MKNVLIAVGLLALISTAAIVAVHKTEDSELESSRIHLPHIHMGKLHLNFIGPCLDSIVKATGVCGAAWDEAAMDITGDIGCVKTILTLRSCGHIF